MLQWEHLNIGQTQLANENHEHALPDLKRFGAKQRANENRKHDQLVSCSIETLTRLRTTYSQLLRRATLRSHPCKYRPLLHNVRLWGESVGCDKQLVEEGAKVVHPKTEVI